MTETRPSRVIVEAPARLHLGFIDLNGDHGRLFGSIGVAVERPRYVVDTRPSPKNQADGEAVGELLRVIRALAGHVPFPTGVAVRVLEHIPRHRGFGSGTQRDLALGCAVSRLGGRKVTAAQLARLLGRGRRSGIGIAAFDRGGLIVDAGLSREPRRGDDGVPPVVFQRRVPQDWFFVVASPHGVEGLSGPREEQAFRDLAPMSEATVGRISRLVLMKALPAVLTDDIEEFGCAITEIQRLVGEHFVPCQGGPYTTERGQAIVEFALKHGALGVGQSSWGPAVFALVRGEDKARALLAEIQGFVGDAETSLFCTRASNRGAVVHSEP